MVRTPAIAIALLVCGCSTPDYVPEGGFAYDWSADLFEDWFASQLSAAKEPSFSEAGERADGNLRFRLLALPENDPARIYRIDWLSDGSAELTLKILNGAGGYAPGELVVNEKRKLSADDAERVSALISAAKLPDIPRELREEPVDGEIKICGGHEQLVFETAIQSDRTFVTRRDCQLSASSPLLRLREFMTQLAGFDV